MRNSVRIYISASCLAILLSSNPLLANQRDIHEALFRESRFPSAATCKTCHPGHYKEWSVSAHAYAQLSPISGAMQAKLNQLTNGTNADFCARCHTPVGMALNEPVMMANPDRHPTSVEGVTCVVCHRMSLPYGKVSGRQGLDEGTLFEKIHGPTGSQVVQDVINDPKYGVTTDPDKEGRPIHTKAEHFPQMTTSALCASCHDVNHISGFRLEEAFSEYKSTPAAKKGISCQDCHMGKEPGVAQGYAHEPIAIVGGIPTPPRKRTNHMFVGPDSSVIHPGVFPHNINARELASIREWLQFNVKAGWGTDDFEDTVDEAYEFPEKWQDVTDRYDARAIIEENLSLLEWAAEERKKLLQYGYQLGDVRVNKLSADGIDFDVEFVNGTDGHNVPTGFDAERVVFLRVTVKDINGNTVFVSGDLDPNGDLRDAHSVYVHAGKLPEDPYLFSLQSKFLVRMLRGGEREMVLPVNQSVDPLPYLRPPTHSTLLLGRPRGARKHRKTIAPLDSQWANYKISAEELRGSEGPYTASIQIIAGMVPVNLIYEIQDAGFDDYGMTAKEIAQSVVDQHITVQDKEVTLKKEKM